MNKHWVFLPLLALLLPSGCGQVQKEKKSKSLEATTRAYGNALRWDYPETAWNYLDPDIRAGLRPEQRQLKEIRLTGYDVIQPPMLVAEDQDQAEQWVRIDYVRHDTQVVKSLTDHQIWRYDEASGGWRLHSAPPLFR